MGPCKPVVPSCSRHQLLFNQQQHHHKHDTLPLRTPQNLYRLTREPWLSHAKHAFQSLIFMQPQPTEISPEGPNTINSVHPASSQYGFQPHGSPPARLLSEQQGSGYSASIAAADASSSSVSSDDSFKDYGTRLSTSRAKATKSPAHRIAEYESALSPSPPRKTSEGPGFKIVRSKGTKLGGPLLDAFPNGQLKAMVRS